MEGATTNERQQCSEAATLARHKQPDSSATQLRLERSLSCSVHQHGAQLGDPSTCAPSGAADDTECSAGVGDRLGYSQRSLRHSQGQIEIMSPALNGSRHAGCMLRAPALAMSSTTARRGVESDIRANAARLEDCAGTSGTYTAEASLSCRAAGHFLFARLPMVQLLCVQAHAADRIANRQGLVTQGEPNARHFFIVASGALEVQVSRLGLPMT